MSKRSQRRRVLGQLKKCEKVWITVYLPDRKPQRGNRAIKSLAEWLVEPPFKVSTDKSTEE